MLKSLSVNKYILIQDVVFTPHKGLTIITGETGAGKSILLDALGLVLGNRADTGIIGQGGEKCIIEAVFNQYPSVADEYLKNQELDVTEELIMRRELMPNGKSRAFINDTPVNLHQLKELGNLLIEIHTQNTGLLIKDTQEQLNLLDDFAQNQNLRHEYAQLWKQLQNARKVLDESKAKRHKSLAEQEFLKFQAEELEKFNPNPEEDDQLIEKTNQLNHAADIVTAASQAYQLISENEPSALQLLSNARSSLKGISQYSKAALEFLNRLDMAIADLKEIGSDLSRFSDDAEPNDKELQIANDRLALMQHLFKKHGVEQSADLLQILKEISQALFETEHFDVLIQAQEKTVEELFQTCKSIALELSQSRTKAAAQLSEKAASIATLLGMPKAKLEVRITTDPEWLQISGIDQVKIQFNANGGPLQDLDKVASGGEVSRLNFVFKSLLADKKEMPTIVFDEADTGISGEVAEKLGKMMEQLAEQHQIIAITHLPQIAAKGKSHFYIRKKEVQNQTITELDELKGDARIEVMAKLLSGEKAGVAAIANAKELLGLIEP